MKIVVIGGTGLIGSKTVAILRQGGHEVVAASPKTGADTITGKGLEEAMAGTRVVIDLANAPSFEDRAVLEFFEALVGLRGDEERVGSGAPARDRISECWS
jgi:nucleoside-diphosphate-sugar epimerase